ncbi:MAG: hypothetical protein BIFFINMI_01395 [Phycisphaerae bacterium]|nr:hypothetical protein [Phycisphaerae bacterium]
MLWIVPAALIVGGCNQPTPSESRGQELRSLTERVAELETTEKTLRRSLADQQAANAKLAAQLEGKAEPINLARTSLASVCASSVNGQRGLDDERYGVAKAFDDGANVGWLGSGEPDPWIDVRFDSNVSVTGVSVEDGRLRRVELFYLKGGSTEHPASADGQAKIDGPCHGVVRVRLHFETAQPPQPINSGILPAVVPGAGEVRVLGFVPANVRFTRPQTPRIHWDAGSATVAALAHYRDWGVGPREGVTAEVKDDGGSIAVTVRNAEMPLARDTFDLTRGTHAFAPLVKLVPIR